MARSFARPRPSANKKSGSIPVVFKQQPYKNQIWHDLPKPTGASPYHLQLSDVLPASQMAAITKSGGLTIHVVGDTGGIQTPIPQQLVADAMEGDFAPTATDVPSFFYILGDVIYYYGEAANYNPQFYEPYLHYPAPIFAIPGNHDGDLATPAPKGVNSLDAFVNNFCATTPHITPDAGPVDRDAMTQPNVYWTLLTPYSTMIGLYSNVPEGGVIKQDQIDWFVSELTSAPTDKALVVSVHHPTFSGDTAHGGSMSMLNTLDAAFKRAGRYPDIVLSGHVHNYQRYTRQLAGRDIPYIVAGGGGYWNLYKLQTNPDGTPIEVPTVTAEPGVTLENYCVDRHGYLKMRFEPGKITGEYYGVAESTQPNPGQATRLDTFAIDLTQHKVITSKRRP
ncbi:MAG: metallophosphoesterase [Thaumarchaeota archaeon]|nr:metallophosphoesterase [Nitrososphaerota archaeon]